MNVAVRTMFNKYKHMPIPIKASFWFTVANILQRSISFLTVPIFTRILTTDDYGLFNVYQSWMSIIVIFATLNLHYGVFNRAMIKFEKDRDVYISSIQGLVTTMTVITLLVYVFAHDFWNSVFELPTVLMLCMFAEILTVPALGFWSGKQRFDYKYKKLVLLSLGMAIISPIIGVLTVILADNKGIARILSAAFVNVSVYSIIYTYNAIKGKKFYVKKYWKFALKFHIPLIPYYLSQMILNQSDRIMISKISGNDKAGIYSVAYSVALVITFVTTGINNSLTPWTYKKVKEQQYKEIGKVANLISVMIASLLLILIAFAPEVIRLLAAPEYYEAIWIVPPVAAGVFFLFQTGLFINIEFYFEENILLVKASLLAAVFNIVLNYIFIRRFGYLAAGYTTLLCNIIFSANNYYYMKKVCRKHTDGDHGIEIYNMKFLSLLSIGFVIAFMMIMMLYETIIIRYIMLLISLIIIFLKRKYIIEKLSALSIR